MRNLIGSLLSAASLVYIFSGIALTSGCKTSLINRAWCIAKWPALASVIWDPAVIIFFDHQAPSTFQILVTAFNAWVWYLYRDAGDDDEFKRLLERSTETVKDIGGRLVVVPVRA